MALSYCELTNVLSFKLIFEESNCDNYICLGFKASACNWHSNSIKFLNIKIKRIQINIYTYAMTNQEDLNFSPIET